jgi:hypothetical protein
MESKAGADSRERRLTPKGPAIAFINGLADSTSQRIEI